MGRIWAGLGSPRVCEWVSNGLRLTDSPSRLVHGGPVWLVHRPQHGPRWILSIHPPLHGSHRVHGAVSRWGSSSRVRTHNGQQQWVPGCSGSVHMVYVHLLHPDLLTHYQRTAAPFTGDENERRAQLGVHAHCQGVHQRRGSTAKAARQQGIPG